MTCLGWDTQPTCAARAPIVVQPAACDADVSWFWIAAAAIVVTGTLKGSSKESHK